MPAFAEDDECGQRLQEDTMRQELMSWLRMIAVALGSVALVGAVAVFGGPALELVALT
jgi:hypothetical protein